MSDPAKTLFTAEESTGDGLTVIYDEATGVITFEWDPDTHPKWNVLEDLGEEEVNKLLMAQFENLLSEHETEDLHDPLTSS